MLAGCHLSELSASIVGLALLSNLDVRLNRLTALPDSMSGMALKFLDIRDNQFAQQALPSVVAWIAGLTVLKCSENGLAGTVEIANDNLVEIHAEHNRFAGPPRVRGRHARAVDSIGQVGVHAALRDPIPFDGHRSQQ